MSYKHQCVVDASCNYRTLVLTWGDQVMHYKLRDGETLVDTAPPVLRPHAGAVGLVRPRWDTDTGEWQEAATEAEIAAWEAAHPDPNARSLEQLRADKLAELSRACGAAITSGCDVVLPSGGGGHISLTAEDQINLSTAMTAVEQGAVGYPYHLDGQLCAIFPAEDIRAMAQIATAHKLEHTTYYNHLAAWVRRCETAEALAAITYGTALPQDLEDNMGAILLAAGEANV